MPSFIEWVTALVIIILLVAGFRVDPNCFVGAVSVLVMWAIAKSIVRGDLK